MKEEKYNLVLENSLEYNSNLESVLSIAKDKLDETNSSGNISQYKSLIRKLITRVNDNSDLKNFCSVIPTKTPSGIVGLFGSKLVGKQSDNLHSTDNIKIIKLDSVASFTENGDISSSGTGVGKVLHVETDENLLLVEVISGAFLPTETVDNTPTYVLLKATIDSVYSNINMVGTLLKNYTGVYATVDGELVSDYNEVEHQVKLADVVCSSKFVTTGYTLEALRDLINIFGYQYKDSFVKNTQSIVRDIERAKIFKFMRDNAYVRPDIILSNSYGTQGNIKDIYSDLYSRVNQSIGAIGTATGITGNYAVVGSSNVVAGLTTLLGRDIITKDGVMYLPNGATLTEDGYTSTDYLLVSLNDNKTDNSAVIFTPYSIDLISAKNPEDFSENVKVQSRSDIINNPLATLENNQSKNEMMEYTMVDFTNLTNQF